MSFEIQGGNNGRTATEGPNPAETSTSDAGPEMTEARFSCLFGLRYSVRVLERQTRLWDRIGTAIKFFSILSGSSALAALMSQQHGLSIAGGVVFAIMQAIEYSACPLSRAAEARAAIKAYSSVLANESSMDDAGLDRAYGAATHADEVVAIEALRRIAYNDVVEEKGCDPSCRYELSRIDRLMAALA